MERKANERLSWKNMGGGTLRLRDGRIIKPGQVFLAYDHQVSKAFRDTIILQDTVEKPKELEPDVIIEPRFSLKRKGGNWYDIVDKQGKVVNAKSLKKVDAEELLKTYIGD
jgi:hypothetical protein